MGAYLSKSHRPITNVEISSRPIDIFLLISITQTMFKHSIPGTCIINYESMVNSGILCRHSGEDIKLCKVGLSSSFS